jgi:hypothetical protein
MLLVVSGDDVVFFLQRFKGLGKPNWQKVDAQISDYSFKNGEVAKHACGKQISSVAYYICLLGD